MDELHIWRIAARANRMVTGISYMAAGSVTTGSGELREVPKALDRRYIRLSGPSRPLWTACASVLRGIATPCPARRRRDPRWQRPASFACRGPAPQ